MILALSLSIVSGSKTLQYQTLAFPIDKRGTNPCTVSGADDSEIFFNLAFLPVELLSCAGDIAVLEKFERERARTEEEHWCCVSNHNRRLKSDF